MAGFAGYHRLAYFMNRNLEAGRAVGDASEFAGDSGSDPKSKDIHGR